MKAPSIASTRPGWGLITSVVAFVLVVAAAGYLYKGRPDALKGVPVTEEQAHNNVSEEQINAMVQGLAARLQQQPDDATGWAMLGRSYIYMGRHAEAKKALQELVRLRPNDPSALADLADATGMVQGRSLQGEPLQWIQRALKIDPKHVKALALAGTEAFDRKDYVQAAKYWETITTVEPADSPVHQQAKAGVEEARRLAAGGAEPPAQSARTEAATPPAPLPPPATNAAARPAAGKAEASVSGTVTLSASLRSKVSPEDTVFVFARPADGSRMPLAILRKQVKDLPLKFTLDDSMGMGQGPNQGLAGAKNVIVGARVSKTGQAMPQPGDLEGFSGTVPVGQTGIQVEIASVK